jgi:hypothetical protein
MFVCTVIRYPCMFKFEGAVSPAGQRPVVLFVARHALRLQSSVLVVKISLLSCSEIELFSR